MCRVTINGDRSQFSTGIYTSINKEIKKSDWNYLHNIESKLRTIYYQNDSLSALQLVKEYKGKKKIIVTELFNLFYEHRKKLIGTKFSSRTVQKIKQVKTHVQIIDKNINSLTTNDLDTVVEDLSEKNYAISTINKTIKVFKQTIRYAIENNLLDEDPFKSYVLTHKKKPISYLTENELIALKKVNLNSRLSNVRDCFLFSCYSGLDYSSSKQFTKNNLVLISGTTWIEMVRKKTNRRISIPLFKEAEKILKKHDYVLPLISNQKFNKYLKEIAQKTNIKVNMTHHLARRTFATTVLMSKGVPIEVVKELLGHSDISTTMSSYATVNRNLIMTHVKDFVI